MVLEMQAEAKTQEMEKPLYEKSGQVQGIVGGVVALIAGMGVATLVLIFVGVLGGQTYNLTEDDIESINDTDVKTHVQEGIKSGFQSIEQTGNYLPIIVLAIVITIVLSLVIGMTALTGGGGMGGRSAL